MAKDEHGDWLENLVIETDTETDTEIDSAQDWIGFEDEHGKIFFANRLGAASWYLSIKDGEVFSDKCGFDTDAIQIVYETAEAIVMEHHKMGIDITNKEYLAGLYAAMRVAAFEICMEESTEY